jgi:hypothetical protein
VAASGIQDSMIRSRCTRSSVGGGSVSWDNSLMNSTHARSLSVIGFDQASFARQIGSWLSYAEDAPDRRPSLCRQAGIGVVRRIPDFFEPGNFVFRDDGSEDLADCDFRGCSAHLLDGHHERKRRIAFERFSSPATRSSGNLFAPALIMASMLVCEKPASLTIANCVFLGLNSRIRFSRNLTSLVLAYGLAADFFMSDTSLICSFDTLLN